MTVSGWLFLLFMTVYLPYASIRSAQMLKKPGKKPTRAQLVQSTLFFQAMMIALGIGVAFVEHIRLFPAPKFETSSAVSFFAFLIPAVASIPIRWRTRSLEEKQKTFWRMPQKGTEMIPWCLVSFGAGISEEILYRGVLLQLCLALVGHWWVAVAICVLAFTVVHAYQGLRSMLIVGLMGIAFHGIVVWTGDLYTAMATHAVYDALAGLIFMLLARREGITPVGGEEATVIQEPSIEEGS